MERTDPRLTTQRSGSTDSTDGLPQPPPMRTPRSSYTPSIGSLLIVVVFMLGMVIGSKMVGGW